MLLSFSPKLSPGIKLKKAHPEIADELFQKMNRDVHHRMDLMLARAAGYKAFSTKDEASVICAFASETGMLEMLYSSKWCDVITNETLYEQVLLNA